MIRDFFVVNRSRHEKSRFMTKTSRIVFFFFFIVRNGPKWRLVLVLLCISTNGPQHDSIEPCSLYLVPCPLLVTLPAAVGAAADAAGSTTA